MNKLHSLLAGVAVIALPVVASAQMAATSGGSGAGMYTVEAYLAQYWFDKDGNIERPKSGGFGGRVTFGAPYMPNGHYFSRPSVGAFITYTAGQQYFSSRDRGGDDFPEVTTLHVGGQLDWKFLPAPAGGVVDPFVGVGAGLFRIKQDDYTVITPGGGFTAKGATSNKLALSPGFGANFTIQKGMSIGIRGDFRDIIIISQDRTDFSGNTRTSTTNNYVAEGGLSFTF